MGREEGVRRQGLEKGHSEVREKRKAQKDSLDTSHNKDTFIAVNLPRKAKAREPLSLGNPAFRHALHP